LPSPAPSCTSTWWPCSTSARTPAGTRLTRYSLSLISFGTPICMVTTPRPLRRGASAPRDRSIVVDLRLLQPSRVIDVDGLPLGEDLDGGRRRSLPVSVAGLFRAAERQVGLRPDGRGVDIGDAGLEVPGRPEGAVHVARVDRRRQAVDRVVGE